MNFRIRIDCTSQTCGIVRTGAAIGARVYGSLKMARAALSDDVDAHVAAMREAKKAALKVKEADLPGDEPVAAAEARAAE